MARERRRADRGPVPRPAPGGGDGADLAERVRLRAEILYATLSVERRTAVRRADLDRADALAAAILTRRRRLAG